MPTTIHLSPELLNAVDRTARGLAMSRNRYIVRALERAVQTETGWSADFVERLEAARADPEIQRAADEMRAAIEANRMSKAPPKL